MTMTEAHISREIAGLEEKTAALAGELQELYGQYLEALGQVAQQGLVSAGFYLCTNRFPQEFLDLSYSSREKLQISLRRLGQQLREDLSHDRLAQRLTQVPTTTENERQARQSQDRRASAMERPDTSHGAENPPDFPDSFPFKTLGGDLALALRALEGQGKAGPEDGSPRLGPAASREPEDGGARGSENIEPDASGLDPDEVNVPRADRSLEASDPNASDLDPSGANAADRDITGTDQNAREPEPVLESGVENRGEGEPIVDRISRNFPDSQDSQDSGDSSEGSQAPQTDPATQPVPGSDTRRATATRAELIALLGAALEETGDKRSEGDPQSPRGNFPDSGIRPEASNCDDADPDGTTQGPDSPDPKPQTTEPPDSNDCDNDRDADTLPPARLNRQSGDRRSLNPKGEAPGGSQAGAGDKRDAGEGEQLDDLEALVEADNADDREDQDEYDNYNDRDERDERETQDDHDDSAHALILGPNAQDLEQFMTDLARSREDDRESGRSIPPELALLLAGQAAGLLRPSMPTFQPDFDSATVRNPEQLLEWNESLEQMVRQCLRSASQSATQIMVNHKILPHTIPDAILEIAMQGEGGSPANTPPGLVDFTVEMGKVDLGKLESGKLELEGEEGRKTMKRIHVIAIVLRLTELEFNHPVLTAWRGKIRQLEQQLRHLSHQYQKRQRDLSVVRAESAWRSSWPHD